MTTLQETSSEIWAAVQAKVVELMQPGNALAGIQTFVPRRRLRVGQHNSPALHVVSRTTRVTEWGANRGIGELSITFGVTHSTVRPGDVGPELEGMIDELTRVFMDTPTLGGSNDIRVEEINPDDDPFGTEDTQPWATASMVWVFQFIQP